MGPGVIFIYFRQRQLFLRRRLVVLEGTTMSIIAPHKKYLRILANLEIFNRRRGHGVDFLPLSEMKNQSLDISLRRRLVATRFVAAGL